MYAHDQNYIAVKLLQRLSAICSVHDVHTSIYLRQKAKHKQTNVNTVLHTSTCERHLVYGSNLS